MKHLSHSLSVETYVKCEKAAKAAGFKKVEEWLTFLISQKVGHTSFAVAGRAYPDR